MGPLVQEKERKHKSGEKKNTPRYKQRKGGGGFDTNRIKGRKEKKRERKGRKKVGQVWRPDSVDFFVFASRRNFLAGTGHWRAGNTENGLAWKYGIYGMERSLQASIPFPFLVCEFLSAHYCVLLAWVCDGRVILQTTTRRGEKR
jgi:hypothetical protein